MTKGNIQTNNSQITCYKQNPRLKAAYNDISFEPWHIQEIIKCKSDIVYFAKKYCKIIHVDRGLVDFEPYPYQEKMLRHMQDNRFSILKTGRQMGKCVSINTLVTIREEPKGFFKKLLIKIFRGNINEDLC